MKAAVRFHLKQEIKFLYIKKQKLKEQLYRLHPNCATYWKKSWPYIQDHFEQKLQKKFLPLVGIKEEVGGGRGDWMDLAEDRDRWRALVGTVRDFRVP